MLRWRARKLFGCESINVAILLLTGILFYLNSRPQKVSFQWKDALQFHGAASPASSAATETQEATTTTDSPSEYTTLNGLKEPQAPVVSFQSKFCNMKGPLETALRHSEGYQIYREERNKGSMGGPFSIALYRTDDAASKHISAGDGWNLNLIEALSEALRELQARNDGKEFGFLDIGGGVGYLSLGVASHGHPVFTLEPMPENELLFRTSICLNPTFRIQYVNTALGERQQSSCIMYSQDQNYGDGVLSCEENVQVPDGHGVRFEAAVNVQPLDTFQSYLSHIGAARMDVNGYEWHVFKGGQTVLGRIPYLIVEVVPEWIQRSGGDPLEMLQWFSAQGYTMSLEKFGGKAVTAEEISGQRNTLMDVYLMKKDYPV